MSSWHPFGEWDLATFSALPADWESEVIDVAHRLGVWTTLSGDSLVSREAQKGVSLPVLVVTGDTIGQELPWLRELYVGPLRELASSWYGRRLYVAQDLRSSVNINCLRGLGARYERHVDSNTVTGVLFVSRCNHSTGGALVFQGTGGLECELYPQPGVFIAFDAREIPHHVTPLRTPCERISVPMNYYESPVDQPRPAGLDEYLYGANNS